MLAIFFSISGNKPHILVLNKKDLVFDPDLKNKKKNVKGETYYFQQDIKERILKAEVT